LAEEPEARLEPGCCIEDHKLLITCTESTDLFSLVQTLFTCLLDRHYEFVLVLLYALLLAVVHKTANRSAYNSKQNKLFRSDNFSLRADFEKA
jgi:hypothetical protein